MININDLLVLKSIKSGTDLLPWNAPGSNQHLIMTQQISQPTLARVGHTSSEAVENVGSMDLKHTILDNTTMIMLHLTRAYITFKISL